MRRLFFYAILWLSVPVAAGCSNDVSSVVTPTAPSGITAPTPDSTQGSTVAVIRGFVTDTAMRPLAGARVEVLDGPAAGTSAVAGSDGIVVLTGLFDSTTRFRATKDGHEALTQTWNCNVAHCGSNASPWLGFYVRPLAPPVDLAGDYTLTITVASTCSTLPAESRSRSYAVTLTPRMREGTADVLGFIGAIHHDDVPERVRRFGIGIASDYASIILRTGHGDEPGLIEYLAERRFVSFMGTAAATVARVGIGGTITLTFDGSIEDVSTEGPETIRRCESSDHQLTLARR